MSENRLFQIVNILLSQKTVTAAALSKRFEVSVRTIYRDIDALSMAGIPVYTTQGKGGGISLLDHYVLDKSVLSDTEQQQILAALQNISAVSGETDALLTKLTALFQRRATEWMEVDLSRWGKNERDKEKFNALRNAILQKHILTFFYITACGEQSERTVKPAKLVFKSKAWYLQAFCMDRQAYRTFKINRISGIVLLPQHFTDCLTPPPIGEVKQSEEHPLLKLKFCKKEAYWLYDEFDSDDIVLEDDGSLIVSVRMPEDGWMYGFLLSFGTSVEVLEPDYIRYRLAEEAKKIWDINYKI